MADGHGDRPPGPTIDQRPVGGTAEIGGHRSPTDAEVLQGPPGRRLDHGVTGRLGQGQDRLEGTDLGSPVGLDHGGTDGPAGLDQGPVPVRLGPGQQEQGPDQAPQVPVVAKGLGRRRRQAPAGRLVAVGLGGQGVGPVVVQSVVLGGEPLPLVEPDRHLVEAEAGWLPTATDEDSSHPYVVETAFDPDRGPWARFRCLETGRTHTLTADNRVAMIYFLAEALKEDLAGRVTDPGWRSNESVRVAVWGRSARHEGPRKLKALLHNIRAELRGAQLDPWCLEKRRGFVRLRVREVEVG